MQFVLQFVKDQSPQQLKFESITQAPVNLCKGLRSPSAHTLRRAPALTQMSCKYYIYVVNNILLISDKQPIAPSYLV